MEKGLNFDYLVIPMLLIKGKGITTLDSLVYGVIYGASKLRQQRCFLSNEGIADTIGTSPGAVANSLARLEEAGAIHRLYNDSARTKRSEIIPLIIFGKTTLKEIEKANKMTSSGSEVTSSGSEVTSSGSEVGLHQVVKLTSSGDEQSIKHKIEENNTNIEDYVHSEMKQDNFVKEDQNDRPDLAAHIKLFEKAFPHEFDVSDKVYGSPVVRDTVGDLMQNKSYEEVKQLIDDWVKYRQDRYAPIIKGIPYLAKWHLQAVEDFIAKQKKSHTPLRGNFSPNKDKPQTQAQKDLMKAQLESIRQQKLKRNKK